MSDQEVTSATSAGATIVLPTEGDPDYTLPGGISHGHLKFTPLPGTRSAAAKDFMDCTKDCIAGLLPVREFHFHRIR
jgi:hypothetical protein